MHNESNEQKWNRWLVVFRKRQFIRRRIFSLIFFINFIQLFLDIRILIQCDSKTGWKEGDGFNIMEKARFCELFPWYVWSYPAAAPLCGLRRWYSTSSTVHTAPLTFSTRIKHLWSDKLWRTAFYIFEIVLKGNKFNILTSCYPINNRIFLYWIKIKYLIAHYSRSKSF